MALILKYTSVIVIGLSNSAQKVCSNEVDLLIGVPSLPLLLVDNIVDLVASVIDDP